MKPHKQYRKFSIEHLETHTNAEITRLIIAKYKFPEEDFSKVRRNVANYRAEIKRLNLRQANPGIVDACESVDVDPRHSNLMWLKNDNASVMVKNPLYEGTGLTEEDIEKVVERVVMSFKREIPRFSPAKDSKHRNNKALKLTISDAHVGMDVTPNEEALFQYEYNRDVYLESMDKVFKTLIKESRTHGTFDTLLIDDLGDLADGFNGQTTRGGHDLPQNMTNAEVFEVCVNAKLQLIKQIMAEKVAKKIILRCVCNDNHAGSFGLIINKAIQMIANLTYHKDVVEIDILTRFMEHRVFGDHCFILTHGKDKKQMFKGLPLYLNDKTVAFINDYIEHYNIKSKYIHVEKGDLHQIGYEKKKKFDYRNFMSFAPPSQWVQHNFGDSYSGFSTQVIPKFNNEISHTDYFLDYKKI